MLNAGDTAYIAGNPGNRMYGKRGTVKQVRSDGKVIFHPDGYHEPIRVDAYNLSRRLPLPRSSVNNKPQFLVGQRVQLTHRNAYFNRQIGTVTQIEVATGHPRYWVRMDEHEHEALMLGENIRALEGEA